MQDKKIVTWIEAKENLFQLGQKHAQLMSTLKRHRDVSFPKISRLLDELEADFEAEDKKLKKDCDDSVTGASILKP